MPKRFTDTDKWDDPWFSGLPNKYKMIWMYLLDKCNTAGVYKVNPEMAEFCVKEKIDWEELEKVLNGRIHKISPEKWFIPKFIHFQYGELTPECKPHIPIINALRSLGVDNLVEIKGYSKGMDTLNTRKGQEKEKDNTRQPHPDCKICGGTGVVIGLDRECNCLK